MEDFFNPYYIVVAGMTSLIGMGAFMYGKRMQDFKFLLIGIALCGISYFISDPLTLALASAPLIAALFSNQWLPLIDGSKNIESIE